MNSGDVTVFISVLSLIFNLLMVTLQARIRGELSELKAHIYERFATKKDVRYMMDHKA